MRRDTAAIMDKTADLPYVVTNPDATNTLAALKDKLADLAKISEYVVDPSPIGRLVWPHERPSFQFLQASTSSGMRPWVHRSG